MNNHSQRDTPNRIPSIPPMFIKYLKTKGIEGDIAVHKFLYPTLADLPKPEMMKNLTAAA